MDISLFYHHFVMISSFFSTSTQPLYFFGHFQKCSKLFPESVFRDHSWQGYGIYMWCKRLNVCIQVKNFTCWISLAIQPLLLGVGVRDRYQMSFQTSPIQFHKYLQKNRFLRQLTLKRKDFMGDGETVQGLRWLPGMRPTLVQSLASHIVFSASLSVACTQTHTVTHSFWLWAANISWVSAIAKCAHFLSCTQLLVL